MSELVDTPVAKRPCGCIAAAAYFGSVSADADFRARMTSAGRSVEVRPKAEVVEALSKPCLHGHLGQA